ncbi:MAG: hypothetical protein FWG04_01990 [Desulfovibrionaceae bacterium]|nr:hypothetical protein [Desulfovibrionaceae bacterium]
MAQAVSSPTPAAIAARKRLKSDFLRTGVITAVLSGMSYGNYTAFMTLAMGLGVWGVWYGPDSGLSSFGVMFLLSALGAAVTDTCSALWALGIALAKGKLGDFFRCLKTKPGCVMMGAALIGGPIASTCYVVGLQQAGSIIVPISALCPAIGAILARILFKQRLTPRMMLGIAICFLASALIGSVGLGEDAPQSLFLGIFFGFLAALGWGLEGSVCGYGTAMIDSEIGITIRQVTSSLSNLFILVPIFAYITGVNPFDMIGAAFVDTEAMPWFIVAGFAAYFAFQLWYKGNAMCGAALGMSCNGMFSFWGPFFCWVILGLIFKQDGWMLPGIAWIAAVVMVVGIFIIAMNPLDLFRKNDAEAHNEAA